MVELEIDGQQVQVPAGTSIIEAAESVGIYIPRYCYHKKLSIAANCRMCLVEVEKVGKPLPACATPVTQDMKVMTQSEKALEAQRSVLEFLLINHPLDCPICDQGGMCELQDYSMGYGSGVSGFCDPKTSVASQDVGPLVETWMTRCIKCTRCVRFGEEIAGLRELGVVNRGDRAEISTYVNKFVDSELSGNITDICPVGALTAKPSRYKARNWEMTEHPTIAAHDCVGSNVYVHTRSNHVDPHRQAIATVPRENERLNESWISDRDRFSYSAMQSDERCLEPMLKQQGEWKQVSWKRVLPEIVDRMRAIIQHQGAEQLAFLTGPNATTEAMYLLQKIARGLDCHNIDHRLRQQDFVDDEQMPIPAMPLSFDELQACDQILLVGSHVRHEQPIIGHRIRQASLDEASVHAINPLDFDFNFDVTNKLVTHDIALGLAEIASAVGVTDSVVASHSASVESQRIAKALQEGERSVLIVGDYALQHPQAETIKTLAQRIAQQCQAQVVFLTPGCNSGGAWRAGAVPHRDASGGLVSNAGKSAKDLFTDQAVRGYFLYNFEPELDVSYASQALQALKKAGLVVCFTPFVSQAMKDYADFILPITPPTETAGTFINVTGDTQSFVATSVPHGDSKPGWKVLRVLGSWLELEGFDFKCTTDVMQELNAMSYHVDDKQRHKVELTPLSGVQRYACQPIYSIDGLVRRAWPLQQTNLGEVGCITINGQLAMQLGVKEGEALKATQEGSSVILPVVVDNAVASQVVRLPAAVQETLGFGSGHGPITLEGIS